MTRKEHLDNPPVAHATYTKGTTSRVAEKPAEPNLYDTLVGELRQQANITDLFRTASSEDFKVMSARLDTTDLKRLRDEYNSLRTALDGKVRLDTFDGIVVNVVGLEWWHSDGFDADGVTMHLRTETEPDKRYKVLTSSAPVVQFANSFKADALPSDQHPARVIFALVPVNDRARAAIGHKKWSVKRLSTPQTRTTDGTPF